MLLEDAWGRTLSHFMLLACVPRYSCYYHLTINFFFFFFLFTTLSKIAISQLLDGLGEDNICPFKGGAH